MADLRIVDAPEIPTENITGEEKLPTGGNGNYSISLDSLADYTKTKKNLADNTSVDGKVGGVRQELETHIEDLLNPHQVTKGQIGLGNVDNTADADKPVSNSTQAAIISAVAPKSDKSYVDNALSSKSDKTYVDNQLSLKANKSDVYTKAETYTKQESDDLVNGVISTALTPVNTSLDLAKRGIANRYDPLLTYNSGERVVLSNGDIVKSTINGNTNDPNVNMTGWYLVDKKSSVNTIAELSTIKNPKDGDVVYVKGYYAPTNFALAQPYKGGGQRIYVEERKAENDGFLCINGWVLALDSINEFTPEHAGANNTDSSDTQALKKLFFLARTQPISIVLQRMYSCTEALTCYYVQTHNSGLSIKGQDLTCGITFKGALSNQVLIDIHGYHADIGGFRINEQTNHANTNIGMRYCGENISVSSIVARGYFKKVILGVAALKSKFSNLDIQTADNTDENFVGIGLQLAACVNTDLTGTSYFGRTDCPLVLGLLDGETYEALKPPSLTETITWNCEGVGIEGIKSVKSNTGMILKGLEIQVSRCISDFNKFKFFTLEGQLIKITDSWFACDTNTPANQEMIGSTGTGCAYATLTNTTFDSGQATAQGQTATFNFPYSTYIANMSSYIACTINSQNEALCLFNKPSITGGTPEWVVNNLSDNSIVLPRTGKSRFSNGINIGKNMYQQHTSKLGIRIDGGERGIELASAMGVVLSTCEGGLVVNTVNPDNNNVLKVGSINSSGRSITATGTINASGSDYAEYMLKSETCGIIKAGDICGINADGELTDKYDESISFVIKSTNPSYVGGDVWSNIPNHPKKPVDANDGELALYAKSLAELEDAFHAERIKYDRIAFCGQVPVNVLGGKSGDYLIPKKLKDGSIGGYYVSSPSFEEFIIAVGKVFVGNIVKVVMH